MTQTQSPLTAKYGFRVYNGTSTLLGNCDVSTGQWTLGTVTGAYYHILQSSGAVSDGVNCHLIIKDGTPGNAIGNGGGISLCGSYNSSNNITTGASIKASKETAGDGNFGFTLDFYTRPNGSSQAKNGSISSTGAWTLGPITPTNFYHTTYGTMVHRRISAGGQEINGEIAAVSNLQLYANMYYDQSAPGRKALATMTGTSRLLIGAPQAIGNP